MKNVHTPTPFRLSPVLVLAGALSLLALVGWTQYQPMGRMQGVAGMGLPADSGCKAGGASNPAGTTAVAALPAGGCPLALSLGERR